MIIYIVYDDKLYPIKWVHISSSQKLIAKDFFFFDLQTKKMMATHVESIIYEWLLLSHL